MTANLEGKPVFINQSTRWFANLLANLELFTAAEIKWANYQERTPEQRAAAVETERAFAGQDVDVSYRNTERFIFDPLRMVEDYLAGGFVYRINVETGLIVWIELVQDTSFSNNEAGGVDREAGRQEAEAIIQRLAPKADLERLSYAENVDPGYYRWEDRSAG